MLGENIQHFRKAKNWSQEELAVRLNVVRQTVSKWEKGLSVPDADILVRIADVLAVSVSQLLDLQESAPVDLSEELARLNALLAEKNAREKLLLQANKKRGLILSLAFFATVAALGIQNEIASLLLAGACMLLAVIILYRNLALLTRDTSADADLRPLRVVSIFSMALLTVVLLIALLTALNILSFSENEEKLLALALISGLMIFTGFIAPKLPFTRHTGLRLPWTVSDEATWHLAHRILGDISLPLALLYIACACTIADFETVTLAAIALWIGIPGAISAIFFYKKSR